MRCADVSARIAVAVLFAFAAACSSTDRTVISVHITRNPGLVVVPAVDQTITDRAIANQLATDIQDLPTFPNGVFNCPIDFGTTYKLVFTTVSASTWSATLSVLGCKTVKLSDGRTVWALNATKLFEDLGAALGLAPDEFTPEPCGVAAPGSRCYAQPTPSNP